MTRLIVKSGKEFVDVMQGQCGFCRQNRTVAYPIGYLTSPAAGICRECAEQLPPIIHGYEPIEGQMP